MQDTSRWRLPPLPPTIRLLRTDESTALNHRYPQSATTVDRCVTCKGTKEFRWYAPTGEVATYDCPCEDQYVLSRWLWHSGILRNYQTLGWRDFEHLPEDAASEIFGYLDRAQQMVDAGIGLIVTGPKGNGKTLIGHLIVKEMIRLGVECYATSFTQMIDIFAEGWRDKDLSRWFNQRMRDAKVLFIDDLGRERNRGAGSVGDNMLETVIRHRVACQMPTIITSNIEGDRLGEAYGGHTESLLSECSLPVVVRGSDRRRDILTRRQQEIRDGITRPVVLQ